MSSIKDSVNIHVMSSGRALFKTYSKALRKYPMDQVFIFNSISSGEDEKKIIDQTLHQCKEQGIHAEFIDIGENVTIESVMEKFQEIYSTKKDAKFWFNVTPGPKPLAMCLFYISIFVEGVCYYISEEVDSVPSQYLEFEKPQIHLDSMKSNPNYKVILSYLKSKKNECSQDELVKYMGYKHGGKEFPGAYIPIRNEKKSSLFVSRKMVTDWIYCLEEWGLVTRTNIDGRSKKIILTSKGRFVISFLD
jgi:hypothetical protein